MNHWLILGIGAFAGTAVGLVIGALCNAAHDGDGCRECRREGELAAQLVEMNEGAAEPEPEDAILVESGWLAKWIAEVKQDRAFTLARDACCEEEAAATLEGPRRAFLRLPMAERRRVMAEQVTDAIVDHYEEVADDCACTHTHRCFAVCPQGLGAGYVCTRIDGHAGPHVACGSEHGLWTWDQAESVALHDEAAYE
jgi:hypothetical protein